MDFIGFIKNSLPLEYQKYSSMITESVDNSKGDYSLPCFAMAKEFHKSPVALATEIINRINKTDLFDKVENVNGYINFFLNKKIAGKDILFEYKNQNPLFKQNLGNGKVVCLDYCSCNLAKYMHIGHLRTTFIGESLARCLDYMGYKTERLNFVGDYGTPWGKMIAGYNLWGNEKEVNEKGVDAIQDLYIKFCKHEEDKSYEQLARDTFKKLEDNDPEMLKIFNWFLKIAIKENKDLLDKLGVIFDSWKGESAYADSTSKIINQLTQKGLLINGENGAKIVNLEEYNLGICVIQKSDDSSLYITRDLAAAQDRYNSYKFDKSFYVTDVAQKLHFSQLFKILELLGYDWAKDLEHIYYGRFSLPEGKISSRIGKQATVKDLSNLAIEKANEIIKDRKLPNETEVAEKVGLGALIFSILKNDKLKDSVFDAETAINFDGDTAPYLQYTYARCSSIIRKFEELDSQNIDLDLEVLNNEIAFEILKIINNFSNTISQTIEKREPAIICKKLLDLAKLTNKYYQTEKVINENFANMNTKVELIKLIKNTFAVGFNLVCLNTIEKM